MNPLGPMKEESDHGESSSFYIDPSMVTPRPMEGLHDTGPTPFLNKTYDLVDDHNTNHIVSWSRGNHSFVVWDPQTFAMKLLPKYFKHNNFSSFVRQLNTYGFRKVDPDKWEFANEGFRRGEKHVLKYIRRKKNPSQSQTAQNAGDSSVEVGCFGLDTEVDWLRCDRQVLMLEVMKLRQQQQNTRANLQAMEKRLKERELKQQQMMKFLARAIQNACLVRTLVQHNDSRKEMEKIAEEKRPIDHGIINNRFIKFGECGAGEHICKIEPPGYGEIYEYEFSELENLAMDMQRLSRVELNLDEEDENKDEEDESSDEGFWKEFELED